jgi:acetyl-CoA carboxylase biotin carboxylase subunit
MEMNTRLQVEHPVTEMVTGTDIVKEQILIAAGEKISFLQDDIEFRGHAIECRINAEDPDNNFMPSPGKIETWIVPGGPHIRVDSHCYSGYSIPPYYDSMIAKFIAYGKNRHEAIAIMLRALKETQIGPIKTTVPLHEKILNRPRFRQGAVSTHFIDVHIVPRKMEAVEEEKAG